MGHLVLFTGCAIFLCVGEIIQLKSINERDNKEEFYLPREHRGGRMEGRKKNIRKWLLVEREKEKGKGLAGIKRCVFKAEILV